jgi:hypothetical protein
VRGLGEIVNVVVASPDKLMVPLVFGLIVTVGAVVAVDSAASVL